MSAGSKKIDPLPSRESPDDRMADAPVAPKTMGVEEPGSCWPDPFDSFTEWSSPADEADYADL